MRRIAVVVAMILGFNIVAFASSTVPLFRIDRNTNANAVYYDLRLNDQGEVDITNPIDSYWLLHARNGDREEITSFQRRAYGFNFAINAQGEYILTLTAVRERPIRIVKIGDEWKAEIVINGQPVYLTSVFVESKSGFLGIPSVSWYVLYGIDPISGEEVSEKIIP